MIVWLAAAWATDHDVPPPVAVEVTAGALPVGPPRRIEVPAGSSLRVALARATPGSTVMLGAGVHRGPLVIDRPLELVGAPGAVLDGGGEGSVLVIAADDVTVSDLAVVGGGRQPQRDDSGVVVAGDRVTVERVHVSDAYLGIDLRRTDGATVRDCVIDGDPAAAFGLRGDGIRLWESHHATVERNVLTGVRDLVVWYSDGDRIVDNRVTGSRYGTHLMHAVDAVVSGNEYHDDVVGIFVMYSERVDLVGNTVRGADGQAGVGIGLKESDAIRVEANVLVDDTTGLYVDGTPHRVDGVATFTGNLIAANEVGARFHGPSPGAVFTDDRFVSNRSAVTVDGRATLAATFDGNTWSDYAGYDLDSDGIGDLPFEVRSASDALIRREPTLAFLAGTPALALIELFGAAFPMFAPTPILIDRRPILDPHREPR
ncbi:MAG: nitrous oxide reductase family maturation protein NosD [Myxococcota bacterium]